MSTDGETIGDQVEEVDARQSGCNRKGGETSDVATSLGPRQGNVRSEQILYSPASRCQPVARTPVSPRLDHALLARDVPPKRLSLGCPSSFYRRRRPWLSVQSYPPVARWRGTARRTIVSWYCNKSQPVGFIDRVARQSSTCRWRRKHA